MCFKCCCNWSWRTAVYCLLYAAAVVSATLHRAASSTALRTSQMEQYSTTIRILYFNIILQQISVNFLKFRTNSWWNIDGIVPHNIFISIFTGRIRIVVSHYKIQSRLLPPLEQIAYTQIIEKVGFLKLDQQRSYQKIIKLCSQSFNSSELILFWFGENVIPHKKHIWESFIV